MPEINYQQLEKYVTKITEKEFSPIYLVHGEEFLCDKALRILSNKLLMDENPGISYEVLEGDASNTIEAIDRVNTFTLLGAKKVVVLSNSRMFYEKTNNSTLMENAKQAVLNNDLKKGAKVFLDCLGINSLNLEDIRNGNPLQMLNISNMDPDEKWINQLMDYCTDNDCKVSSGKSSMDRLQTAVEKGFAEKNHLIITTEFVDKRRQLYKSIKEHGLIVDCSVPKGERKADKDAQNIILNEQLKITLGKAGKSMASEAFSALTEMTGFDLRTFDGNVEKLIDYVGNRKNITLDDVNGLLSRTKVDPIFEITNAVSDRNSEKALYSMHFLISDGMHPLQILAALINQVRKLMVCRTLIDELQSRGWHEKISYPEFQRSILPMVVEYERLFLEDIGKWEDMLKPLNEAKDIKSKKGHPKPSKPDTDMVIAKNPSNAYPIYQLMIKSARFSMKDLSSALSDLYHADSKLKTTGLNPRLIIEKTIINICKATGKQQ